MMASTSTLLNPFEVTAPIFLLMVLGYFAVRLKYFPEEGVKGLSAFVARVAVPVLIFKALAERDLTQTFDVSYLIAYGFGSLVPFMLVFVYARRIRQQDTSSAAFYGMGGSFSNTVMVGYPVATSLFGDVALIPIALTFLVENLIMMPMTIALADSNHNNKQDSLFNRYLSTFYTISKNPIVIAMVLGVLASMFSLPIPQVGNHIMELLAATVSGVALFSIGGMLVGLRTQGLLPDIAAVTLTKLVLHPLSMLGAFSIVGAVTADYAAIAVLLACSPMFSIYAVIGEQYGKGQFCAAAMLPTTVLSFASISVVIWAQQIFS